MELTLEFGYSHVLSPVPAIADPARFEAQTRARRASGTRFGLAAPLRDRVMVCMFVLAVTPNLPATYAHMVLEASARALGARERFSLG